MRDTVETLYHSGNCVCMADNTDKSDAPLIGEKAIDNALRHIASGKFDPAADIEPHLFEETRSALDIAARKGVGEIAYGHPDCIPNWRIGCELAAFHDIFWNTESLGRVMDDKKAAGEIAELIAAEEARRAREMEKGLSAASDQAN